METTQILLIIASIFLAIGWLGIRKMCPICHRWNGLKKINSSHERDETRYTKETVSTTRKDKYGRVIGTVEKQESIPYNVSFYKVTFRCRSCNHLVERTIRNGQYIKEAIFIFILSLVVLLFVFNSETNKVDTINKNEHKVQNNNDTNFEKNSSSDDLNIKKNQHAPTSSPEIQTKSLINTNKKAALQEELEDAPTDAKKVTITEKTSDYLKKKLAVKMLDQGKSINEIADSTFLPKKEIRKLKRSINKK